jgi:hypothetical protein
VTFPVILNFYAVWTESLYIIIFIALVIQLRKEEKFQSVLWIAVIVCLLCLCRMVGIVAAGSLLIAYIIDKRSLRGLLLFLSGLAVIIGWTLLGTYHLGETARSVEIHLISAKDLWYIVYEMGFWLTPAKNEIVPLITGSCILIFPLLLFVRAWKSRLNQGVLYWFLIIHFYAYVLFIILSKSMLDASIAFDQRTLFPLMINLVLILIVVQSNTVLSVSQRRKMRFVLPKLFLICIVLNATSILNLRENGVGYNSKEWRGFSFIPSLKLVEADIVYTNDQAALYLQGDKIVHPALLPQKIDLYSHERFDTYEAEMDVMLASLYTSKNGKIIWIRNGITGDVFPNYEELKENPNLEVVYDDWLCLILEIQRLPE